MRRVLLDPTIYLGLGITTGLLNFFQGGNIHVANMSFLLADVYWLFIYHTPTKRFGLKYALGWVQALVGLAILIELLFKGELLPRAEGKDHPNAGGLGARVINAVSESGVGRQVIGRPRPQSVVGLFVVKPDFNLQQRNGSAVVEKVESYVPPVLLGTEAQFNPKARVEHISAPSGYHEDYKVYHQLQVSSIGPAFRWSRGRALVVRREP